ncbi:MAG: hypothetical protein JNL12_11810, partial [Planctomycetes bacterium]|nr:hypothetical protein [Planctomycetota bacterium]
MNRVPALAAVLLLAAIAAAQTPSPSLAPDHAIVAALLHDTDGDGRAELLLVDARGTVARHGVDAGGFVARGTLALPDPQRSLFAFADLLTNPGTELVVADGNGTSAWTWPAAAAPQPVPLLRRARSTLPLGVPQRSPFVQDLDRDGKLDVLLPTLQGVQPFRQAAPADDGTPTFQALPNIAVRVRSQVADADGRGDRERTGELVVPPVDTEDLDGDGRPDLLTRDG